MVRSSCGAPPAEAEETRQPILRAAFQAFSEKGYVGESTLLIATRAKVSNRGLYALLPNKGTMLVACITSRSERMRMPEGLPEPEDRQMLASTLEALGTYLLTETLHPDVIGMYRTKRRGGRNGSVEDRQVTQTGEP